MIQRIQTVYLFLITILSVIFFTGSVVIAEIDDNVLNFRITQFDYTIQNQSINLLNVRIIAISLFSSTLLSGLLSFIAIFLFRKRKLQLNFTVLVAIFSLVIILIEVWLFVLLKSISGSNVIPTIRMLIPPALFFLALLAFRGIRKDEKLVRSYERLR